MRPAWCAIAAAWRVRPRASRTWLLATVAPDIAVGGLGAIAPCIVILRIAARCAIAGHIVLSRIAAWRTITLGTLASRAAALRIATRRTVAVEVLVSRRAIALRDVSIGFGVEEIPALALALTASAGLAIAATGLR